MVLLGYIIRIHQRVQAQLRQLVRAQALVQQAHLAQAQRQRPQVQVHQQQSNGYTF